MSLIPGLSSTTPANNGKSLEWIPPMVPTKWIACTLIWVSRFVFFISRLGVEANLYRREKWREKTHLYIVQSKLFAL